jgi:hypothetical protein
VKFTLFGVSKHATVNVPISSERTEGHQARGKTIYSLDFSSKMITTGLLLTEEWQPHLTMKLSFRQVVQQ